MPRYLASVSLLLAGLVPVAVGALGLGEIDLKSGLNQPFVAEIGVSSEASNDLTGLDVGLASADTFNQFGLDRAPFLTDFKFAVVSENGRTRIDITSVKPVVEPFVTLLLEIRWPQGRLLREFTVLLDPPAFAVREVEPAIQEPVAGPAPVPAETQIVRTPAPAETAPETPEPEPVVPSIAAPAPVISAPVESVAVEPAPSATAPVTTDSPEPAQTESQPSIQPTAAVVVDGSYGPVVRNDTLWAIAGRVAPDDSVDRNQMMLAIYRANPEAFAGNINRLMAGVILRVPDAGELTRLGRIEARNEVQRQEDEWKRGADSTARLRLVPPSEEGTDDSSVAQPGSDVSSAGAATAEQRALRQRVAELEAELSDSERLISIRDEELQALQAQLAALEQREEAAAQIGAAVTEEPFAELGDDSTAAEEEGGALIDEGLESEAFGDEGVEGVIDDEAAEAEEPIPAPLVAEVPGAEVAIAEVGPSVVVTTTGADVEPSLIGGLLTNVWFYVSLFGVVILALFVVRRRSSEPPMGDWDELHADDPALGDVGGQEDALAGAADFAAGTPEEATFIVEEAPSEPTIQEVTTGDLAEEVSSELEAEFSGTSDDISDAESDTGAGADLLGDDLLVDSADADLFEVAPEESAAESEIEPESESGAGQEPHETALERTISIASGANLDQADPLAEADFHMAYGLYDQAADLLTEELRTSPERKDLRLKLLEVYFIWENASGFLREAEEIKAYLSGDSDPDWSKVLIMGKQICPNEALFSAAPEVPGEAADMDLVLADEGPSAEGYDVDIPLEDATGLGADISFEDNAGMPDLNLSEMDDVGTGGLDFDLGAEDLDADELNASTMETPTIESPLVEGGDDETADTPLSASTMETPTVDIAALEPTVESPIGDQLGDELDGGLGEQSGGGSTMETPTVDIASLEPTMEMVADNLSGGESTTETPTVDMPAIEPTIETPTIEAELPIDDSEITGEVTGRDFSSDDEVGPDTASEEEELLEMSSMDLAAETLQIELDEDTNIRQAAAAFGVDDARTVGEDSITDDDDDIFMDLEPTEVLQKGSHDHLLDETVEQAGADEVANRTDSGSSTDTFRTLQLAEGSAGQESGMEASTMTEVGTKLDLARAYIDMGDPDGARSILNEVLEEAGDSQRQEAQQLLAGLG
jgi:pilus assembly protein FimV